MSAIYKYRLINTAAIIKDAKITLGKYIRFFASLRSEYMEVWRGGGGGYIKYMKINGASHHQQTDTGTNKTNNK